MSWFLLTFFCNLVMRGIVIVIVWQILRPYWHAESISFFDAMFCAFVLNICPGFTYSPNFFPRDKVGIN